MPPHVSISVNLHFDETGIPAHERVLRALFDALNSASSGERCPRAGQPVDDCSTAPRAPETPTGHNLRTPQAAKYLDVAPNTLANWRVRGGGPNYSKIGRTVVYAVVDLDDFRAQRRRASTSELRDAN